jgi:hypothetical protein
LSSFLYSLLGSGIDRFVPLGCDFLQYADDIVVTPRTSDCLCLGSDGLLVTQRFFSLLGLTISSTKSEVVLFSRKHLRPSVLIRIGGRLLPQVVSFKYLGVFFDVGLRWIDGWIVSGGVALLHAGHKTGLMCTTVYL